MPMMPWNCLLFSLVLTTVSCGSDDDDGGSQLQCSTYGWCTSYGALDEDVTDAPALTGGTIANGVYRLQAGTFGADAFAFDGSTVVSIGDGWSNRSGTWTADGGRLTMNLTTYCNYEGDEASTDTWEYDFAVQGDNLYLLYVGGINNTVHRYKKVSSLCTEDSEFQCRVTNCACSETVNEPLPEENCY